ncbi:MAG: AI-2E family transporter [Sarcina sp.]
MKFFKNDNLKYVKWFFVIIISYLVIKIIDNSDYFLSSLSTIYSLLFPFILAFIIAYILSPVVKLFNKKLKLSNALSIALTYAIFVSLLVLGSLFLFPKLYLNIIDFIDSLPTFSAQIQDKLTIILGNFDKQFDIASTLTNIDINSIVEKFSSSFTSMFTGILNFAITFTTSLVNIVFGFLISIYVLMDKKNFLSFGRKITLTTFGKNSGTSILEFLNILNKKVGTYITIKALDSLIISTIALIGLYFLDSKYVLLLAVVVGLTNMIPYFGPFIGMLVAFTINLFAADFKLALISLIFLFILQQFDAWYLDPKLIGNKIGISPYVVILSVTIGGFILGPVGMILASPVASVIKIYTEKLFEKYEYRRKGLKKINTQTIDSEEINTLL